jgi:hypothetical protein
MEGTLSMMIRYVIFSTLLSVSLLHADPKPSEREQSIRAAVEELTPATAVELKALEIRAKIYEPQIYYVLDRAKIDVEFKEEEVRFSPRNSIPIEENLF